MNNIIIGEFDDDGDIDIIDTYNVIDQDSLKSIDTIKKYGKESVVAFKLVPVYKITSSRTTIVEPLEESE